MEKIIVDIKGTILENYTDTYLFQNKTRVPDGAGGFIPSYKDGASFVGVHRHDSTVEAQVAEREGTASTYTLFVDKEIEFKYHDIIKRKSDNSLFRITEPEGKSTPCISKMNMKCIKCEKWEKANVD